MELDDLGKPVGDSPGLHLTAALTLYLGRIGGTNQYDVALSSTTLETAVGAAT